MGYRTIYIYIYMEAMCWTWARVLPNGSLLKSYERIALACYNCFSCFLKTKTVKIRPTEHPQTIPL